MRAAARPVLGALAGELVARRLHEPLGYRSLGDYARERLGVGARAVSDWARVWRALAPLPLLREAVVSGEVGFAVARLVVGLATPETESACLETVRGRTVRAVEAIVRAVREGERAGAAPATPPAGVDPDPAVAPCEDPCDADRVRVRLGCTMHEKELWHAALELARRMAGQSLPVWGCAEWIAAEAASGLGMPETQAGAETGTGSCTQAAPRGVTGREAQTEAGTATGAEVRTEAGSEAAPSEGAVSDRAEREACARGEPSAPERGVPAFAGRALRPPLSPPVERLARGAQHCSAREIDRRLREVIAFLQRSDLELGRILRQMVDRRLFREVGCESLERYATERLDCSPRTARRLVALARLEHRAPPVAAAFGEGVVSALQASALARVADRANARAWLERARQVSLRRLEDEVDAAFTHGAGAAIAFRAPRPVATLFVTMLRRAGSLEKLLVHAITTWLEAGDAFVDYADFERDGFRCAVPGCTARRELQSHHIDFLAAGGADESWNRITLCARHHLRGVHAGVVRIRGRAPSGLVFALGVERPERFASGDVRLPPGRSSG